MLSFENLIEPRNNQKVSHKEAHEIMLAKLQPDKKRP
jgi:hypothetical protein